MALVVLGSESLDELAGYVKEYFSPVPRGNVPRNTFENQGFPFQVRPMDAETPSDEPHCFLEKAHIANQFTHGSSCKTK